MLLFLVLAIPRAWAQGPPFQTDDPAPVDFQNYEFYVFSVVSSAPTETDPLAPACEFNWGAVPRVQIHTVLPFGAIIPVHQGTEAAPTRYGLTDMELGLKVAVFLETKSRPQIGTFPMLELPTGDASSGLGVGKVWYKVPFWLQKNFGPWTLDGGGGYVFNSQDGFGNYPYGGFLLKRKFREKWEFAGEVFAHGGEGVEGPYAQKSTLIDGGGYYHFKAEGLQLLFAYGHSIAGDAENYAYLGIYKTWGKHQDADTNVALDAFRSAPRIIRSQTQ